MVPHLPVVVVVVRLSDFVRGACMVPEGWWNLSKKQIVPAPLVDNVGVVVVAIAAMAVVSVADMDSTFFGADGSKT